jgi:predicted RNA binding protein YcfA (HicA-like mRNA interferase family)
MLYRVAMPVSGKQIIKLLKMRGWQIKGQRGSHVKLVKDGKTTEVPVHGNKDLGKGLINAIEKQTGEKIL